MKKIILSGGGTGGHIYPAVAVAEALERRFGDDVELLFVGAEGKMEMEKVPALGYRIVGLPIAGLQRRMDWHNLAVPLKVLRSIRMAKKDHPRFRGRCGGGLRGLRQRPGVVGCTAAGGADGDSGAELLCRADQQDTVQAGEAGFASPRGHGTLFPADDHDDGLPAGPLLERGSRPGRGVGLLRL